MNTNRFDRAMIVVDIVVATLSLLTYICEGVPFGVFSPLFFALIALRLWFGFLNYRRSSLAVVPTAIIVLLMTLIAVGSHGHFMRFAASIVPVWDFLYHALLMCGVEQSLSLYYQIVGISSPWVELLNLIWFAVLPIAHYLFRLYKQQSVASRLSAKQITALTLYLVATLFIGALTMISALQIVPISIMAIMVLLIPILFKLDGFSAMLTRGEKALIICYLLLIFVGYAGVVTLPIMSALALFVTPVVLYWLSCWCSDSKVEYKALLLFFIGSSLFWAAQYTTNIVRIVMLILSLAAMAVAVVRFAYATKRYWAAAALYIVAAVVVPIVSIGYNPYATLDAGVQGLYTGYSRRGVFCVKSDSGVGLRDRYGTIIPAKGYTAFEMVGVGDSLCKAYSGDKFQIFDFHSNTLLSPDWFTEIIPDGEDCYKLKCENGYERTLCKDSMGDYVIRTKLSE